MLGYDSGYMMQFWTDQVFCIYMKRHKMELLDHCSFCVILSICFPQRGWKHSALLRIVSVHACFLCSLMWSYSFSSLWYTTGWQLTSNSSPSLGNLKVGKPHPHPTPPCSNLYTSAPTYTCYYMEEVYHPATEETQAN